MGPITFQDDILAVGGQLCGAKLTSAWKQHTTSTFTVNYNNKGRQQAAGLRGHPGHWDRPRRTTGPPASIRGILQGSGALATGGNLQNMALDTSQVALDDPRRYQHLFKEGCRDGIARVRDRVPRPARTA